MRRLSMIIIIIVFVLMYVLASYVETHYTREGCKVIAVEGTYVTVEDECGYTWGFACESHDDYQLGELVDLKMFTNHTNNNIYDDEIIEVN